MIWKSHAVLLLLVLRISVKDLRTNSIHTMVWINKLINLQIVKIK